MVSSKEEIIAYSIPIDELEARLDELPQTYEIIAYCPYFFCMKSLLQVLYQVVGTVELP